MIGELDACFSNLSVFKHRRDDNFDILLVVGSLVVGSEGELVIRDQVGDLKGKRAERKDGRRKAGGWWIMEQGLATSQFSTSLIPRRAKGSRVSDTCSRQPETSQRHHSPQPDRFPERRLA